MFDSSLVARFATNAAAYSTLNTAVNLYARYAGNIDVTISTIAIYSTVSTTLATLTSTLGLTALESFVDTYAEQDQPLTYMIGATSVCALSFSAGVIGGKLLTNQLGYRIKNSQIAGLFAINFFSSLILFRHPNPIVSYSALGNHGILLNHQLINKFIYG